MSLHKEHILKLSNSEDEYKLIIIVEDNDNSIQLNLINIKNKAKDNYYLKLSLEELITINKYFLIFETILDCANNISNIIKDCTPKLIKENKGMSLYFTLFIPGQDKREIHFLLEEKPFDPENQFNEMKEEINKLKGKVNDLEIIINQKDKFYESLKCKYDELKNDYESNVQQINVRLTNIESKLPPSLSQEILHRDPGNERSTIISNILELNILSNKIRSIYPGKNVEYHLLYRKSRDSDKANIFHSKCDNFKGTLIIIKTTEDYKFGGYTNEKWGGINVYKTDNTAFIFSLNYNKIYDIKKNKNAIFCSPFYGPIFCGENAPTLIVNDNYATIDGECGKANDSNYIGFIDDYEINGKKNRFKISELEVFEVTLK